MADVEAVGRISAIPSILEVVAETTGMRFVTVARVTEGSWTACAVLDKIDFGLRPGAELDITTTLCAEVRDLKRPVVIDNVSENPTYRDHPIPRMYQFESYISFPIFKVNGEYFGTLCAIDPLPAKLSDLKVTSMMESFSKLISVQLESEDRHRKAQEDLLDQRQTAELREQFIAVLGHDLRNPLFAISSGADLLTRRATDATMLSILNHMRTSSERASRLVDDVLDFARGRLGGGIPVDMQPCRDLEEALLHVIAELKGAGSNRVIHTSLRIPEVVFCDRDRIAQLLSNLLMNALTHGASDQPVTVSASSGSGGSPDAFVLSVSNHGPAIPRETLPQLFQPFHRSVSAKPQAGLGLGLYIASEIARSHGGRMEVTSSDRDGTTFTFTMPRP
ncbi:sensor histidine kinase [Skermanella stibiiresistens SB22]|uniref:histidine kinase n=1 Tax=Skermanella stibiiresistens SB22 TaxID=1385369 RepID=W9GWI0_9PROT|nr:GAF domain-containing sensor histidine kinase [Skermanella stibiiresistens]EWY37006.1 sensor histidine kinase [Skermanella stibiiresistens SB22]